VDVVVDAVYENGVFRPSTPVPSLPDGARVVLSVRARPNADGEPTQPRRTREEVREFIRSKSAGLEEEIPQGLWDELANQLK
jgi:predicted DNA-binding antitoxin AbrB/MazE fold protein